MTSAWIRTPLYLALLLGLSATAQAVDLQTVYRDALAYDAQFAAARAGLDAGREALPQGRAGLLPTVTLTANSMRNDIDINKPSISPNSLNFNSRGWTVQLTQPLFRWDRWAAYSQAEARVALAEAQFILATQDLITRTVQAYFDVLQANEALSAAQANRKAISEQQDEANKAFEVGTKTVVEVHDAKARFDLANAQEIVAANDLAVKRQQLRLLTGKDYSTLSGLKTGVTLPTPQPNDAEKWAQSAETGYAGVAVAQAGVTVSEEEISRQRAGHLPSLDLVASRSNAFQGKNQFYGNVSTDIDTTTVGVQLTVPLFSGGATSSAVSQAAAQKEKAQADLDNARRSAALQARQAYLGVSAGLAQVGALEAALLSSQSALDSNKLGFEVGVRTNIEVLNAQSQFYSTKQNLSKARLDTLTALVRLKAAAGTLGEDDVKSINALLEP